MAKRSVSAADGESLEMACKKLYGITDIVTEGA